MVWENREGKGANQVSNRFFKMFFFLGLAILSISCSGDRFTSATREQTAGTGGNAGSAANSTGGGGAAGSNNSGGNAGKGGAAASGGSSAGGKATGGQSGASDNGGAAGDGGNSSAGTSSQAGQGGSGNGGSAGIAGSGGSSGQGGQAGSSAGTGGKSGAGGSSGNSGTGGQSGSGNGGSNTGGGGSGGAAPACGNNNQESGEICDKNDLNQQTCQSIPGDFNGGTLKCQANCQGFDTTSCTKPTPCTAGASGTVDQITASGAIKTALFIHYQDSPDFFSTETPTMANLSGKVMPAQLVLLGQEGLQFDLKNGLNSVSKVWYQVDSLPTPQCDGPDFQTCLATLAKAFRCQHSPYNEGNGCPDTVTFTEKPATNFYTSSKQGFQIILINLSCP